MYTEDELMVDNELIVFLDSLEDKDRKDVFDTIKELTKEYKKIDDANETIKSSAANIKEVFGLSVDVFKKFSKLYYEQNLKEERVKVTKKLDAYEYFIDSVNN